MTFEFSDAQVIAAIGAAIRAHDMPAVVGLLHVLARPGATRGAAAHRLCSNSDSILWTQEVMPTH